MNEQNLKDFALELLEEGGKDWDGFDLEELAEKHGLLIRVTRRAPCMEDGCVCAQNFSLEEFERGDVQCFDKADYLFTKAAEYTRPELTDEDKKTAAADVTKLMRKYGMGNVPKIIGALALENLRLVKEINEHRAARGIDPLPTFEV